jgi:hypothetical protein
MTFKANMTPLQKTLYLQKQVDTWIQPLTHNFPTSGLKKQIFLEIEIRYIV